MPMTPLAHTGWNPSAEMRRLQTEMNRLFNNVGMVSTAQVYPLVNLWLGENSIVVTAELPGLPATDVELTVHEDTLNIRGERRPVEGAEQAGWHRRERPHGIFSRTVGLPFRIDPDQVQARFDNGVLEVEMQRPEADRPHKIEIKSN